MPDEPQPKFDFQGDSTFSKVLERSVNAITA
jgi:hypothetical protein